MANIIVFAILAAVILCAAIFSVMTKSIMRSVTALLFVLFAIAGLYFLLDYTFIGTAQLGFCLFQGGAPSFFPERRQQVCPEGERRNQNFEDLNDHLINLNFLP